MYRKKREDHLVFQVPSDEIFKDVHLTFHHIINTIFCLRSTVSASHTALPLQYWVIYHHFKYSNNTIYTTITCPIAQNATLLN